MDRYLSLSYSDILSVYIVMVVGVWDRIEKESGGQDLQELQTDNIHRLILRSSNLSLRGKKPIEVELRPPDLTRLFACLYDDGCSTDEWMNDGLVQFGVNCLTDVAIECQALFPSVDTSSFGSRIKWEKRGDVLVIDTLMGEKLSTRQDFTGKERFLTNLQSAKSIVGVLHTGSTHWVMYYLQDRTLHVADSYYTFLPSESIKMAKALTRYIPGTKPITAKLMPGSGSQQEDQKSCGVWALANYGSLLDSNDLAPSDLQLVRSRVAKVYTVAVARAEMVPQSV